jgi:hypothetical protein
MKTQAQQEQSKERAPEPQVKKRYNRPLEESKRLGISRRQLTKWMKNRIVPFIKNGRTVLFDPVKVDAALAQFEHLEISRQ